MQQRNIESIKKEKKILEELDLDIGNEYTLLGKRDAIEKNLTKMRVEYLIAQEKTESKEGQQRAGRDEWKVLSHVSAHSAVSGENE